jgi:transposase
MITCCTRIETSCCLQGQQEITTSTTMEGKTSAPVMHVMDEYKPAIDNGRGRHIAVDTEGWLLALVVTAANISDKAGAKVLVIRLFDAFSALAIMWADSGYNGKPLAAYMKSVAAITLEVVTRAAPHSFQVIRRRWVVERTFGWLMRYRRLVRDYERRTGHHEAMVYWATVLIMTRRLSRYENSQPPVRRWGGERPKPEPAPTPA